MEKTTKTVGQFVLLSIPGAMVELHASGCRDLKGFNENPIVAESAQSALDALVENGTISKETKVRVMPCTNPVRMRAINRLFEVDTETGLPVAEPTVAGSPEEPVELAPATEEAPAKPKRQRKSKKAAEVAPETTEAPAEVAEVA